jgi:hypothetical protein
MAMGEEADGSCDCSGKHGFPFLRAAASAKQKGANLSHPSWRHREAPWGEVLQAAPRGACLSWDLPIENSRFSKKTVAVLRKFKWSLFSHTVFLALQPNTAVSINARAVQAKKMPRIIENESHIVHRLLMLRSLTSDRPRKL